MKIKFLKGITCTLVALFLIIVASEAGSLIAKGRAFIYELAQMPEEEAHRIVERIIVQRVGGYTIEEVSYIHQAVEIEMAKYRGEFQKLNIIDRIYLEYNDEYVPIKKEIGIPVATMAIVSLVALELTQAYREDKNNG